MELAPSRRYEIRFLEATPFEQVHRAAAGAFVRAHRGQGLAGRLFAA